MSPGSTHHYNFLGDFCKDSIKLKNVGPPFSSFNLRPFLPSIAKDDLKQFWCLNIVFNNKAVPLFFFFQLFRKKFSLFENVANNAT